MNNLTLGIIGGLGPAATVYFMDLVTSMTKAEADREHLEILVHSAPSTPDRTEYILNKAADNPIPRIIEVGRGLVRMGADVIAIPCMTAHAFHDEIQHSIDVPVLNGITLTAKALCDSGVKKAGVMATDGTIKTMLFQNELTRFGIEAVTPCARGQEKVMSLIYDDIKTGRAPDMIKFKEIKEELLQNEAECIILGCTELSLIKRDMAIGNGFADTTEILAWHSIYECQKTPKRKYSELVTKIGQ